MNKISHGMRLLLLVIPLAPILLVQLLNFIQTGNATKSSLCKVCHEDILVKAINSPYQHNVVLNDCQICHLIQDDDEEMNNTKITMETPFYQKDAIFYIDNVPEDEMYQVDVVLTDEEERRYERRLTNSVFAESMEYYRYNTKLNEISAIKLEEVKIGPFVEATISWITDAPATSQMEYMIMGDTRSRIEIGEEDVFTKNHKITIYGLKHNKKYFYRLISRDFYGNWVQSKDLILDTSRNIACVKESTTERRTAPLVDGIKAFRIKGKDGFYLMVSANKPSQVWICIETVRKREDKLEKVHGTLTTVARFSRIDACISCHQQDASHPVGIKASGSRVRTPLNLPTIDDGVITCVTCHLPHGGTKKYFARMDLRAEICVSCHDRSIYVF